MDICKAGDGVNYPQQHSTVFIHYQAYLPNGKEFDSTYRRGKPFSFEISASQVIPGLEEAVMQLSIGERALIQIPSSKGYGSKGFPGL